MYRLTEEGKKYLKEGLPEIKLIEFLKSHSPISVKDSAKQIENFSIALNWAKKNGWIKIDKGMLILLKEPDKYEQEEALKKVAGNKQISEQLIKQLMSRKLIEEIKESIIEKAKEQLENCEIKNLTVEIIKSGLWQTAKFKSYNVEVSGKKIYPGKRHPYQVFLNSVRRKLIELGFKEMTGPIIELEFWNFDALYQAQNHPARDWTQTYSLKYPKYGKLPNKNLVESVRKTHENGWLTGSTGWRYKWDEKKAARLMPRAHDTAISPRYLSQIYDEIEIPGKYFSLVRCFRPDVIDATHGVEFNQLGGFIIGEKLTFRDLLGLLKLFAEEIAGAKKIKFYPDYYPFTEPSVQLSAYHEDMGWIEFAGAGIFRPEVTLPLGIKYPVIAWGLGIDRLAMFRLGIKDIRELFSRNLDWLRNFEVIKCQQ
ncbi:MAG: phenylalanine--tRNA ligase subunit alpha [Candidatus Aenigmarchaeota archaeon]|nr:phenylalanine--tRNA ligase subunit alpha [Candidatus Aenigmarchaeota archaeon]